MTGAKRTYRVAVIYALELSALGIFTAFFIGCV
jgi:hypothetical protein